MSLYVIGSIAFSVFGVAPGPIPVANLAGALNANAVVETLNTTYVVRFGPPVLTSAPAGVPAPPVDATSAPYAFMANFLPGKAAGTIGGAAFPVVTVATAGTVTGPGLLAVNILDTNTIQIILTAAAIAGTNVVAMLLSTEAQSF